MKKTLSARIAQHMVKTNLSRSTRNRAAFLMVREDIKLALNDGWSIKNIWQTLHAEGKITIGYKSFTKYVRRFLATVQNKTSSASIDQNKQTLFETPGFRFNPHPNPDDLI